MPATFAMIRNEQPWRPIPRCPGRFVLPMTEFDGPPEALAGSDTRAPHFKSETAADPVAVMALDRGGLISYRKPDGRYLHTLNSAEGFARKLEQLGITLPCPDA